MNRIRHNRLKPILLLSAALLLRAVIPVGYMPAAFGNGLLFELCPDGIPDRFAQILTFSAEHHHTHADHGDSAQDDHQCLVGHMLLSATAVDDGWQTETAPLAPALAASSEYSYFYVSRPFYRPRDPPA